uniref:Uncharacterized protein n=1 Tax=Sphaerodactylus townsendi TaxID=933632 RepID=A0ACB8ECM2_9SAUR
MRELRPEEKQKRPKANLTGLASAIALRSLSEKGRPGFTQPVHSEDTGPWGAFPSAALYGSLGESLHCPRAGSRQAHSLLRQGHPP